MDDTVVFTRPTASLEEVQQGWHELKMRIGQLEAERAALEQDNKTLRSLLERVIEHRQKSHGELVLLLSNLVSKLPINDVGLIVSKLIEHNTHVGEVCAQLAKGRAEAALPQPAVLQALDQTKRNLAAAVKLAVEELIRMDPPFEKEMLESLIKDPESFFAPKFLRANRGFVKGQLPKERIVRDFGEQALGFFTDMTTDSRRNPRPKPEEIMLAFKCDCEELLKQDGQLPPEKREALHALFNRVQRSKSPIKRPQRVAFAKLSFLLDLLHYYDNQNTEAPEAVFAQRLPALVEQMVIVGTQENLDEKSIAQVEALIGNVISPDHRLMIVNNVGKGGGLTRTLKFVLRLRVEKNIPSSQTVLLNEVVPDFVRHLTPEDQLPPVQNIIAILRLIPPEMQRLVAVVMKSSDRLRKSGSEGFIKALAQELGLTGLEDVAKNTATTPEMERQRAWDDIKDLIVTRRDPSAIATAIRKRLHEKYDADEVKQSWLTLMEADVMTFIRTFCQLPYLGDGRTDNVARAAMETYVIRLTHEKYAATYKKVVNSLRNMFHANANSPTLVNFMALVKWLDVDSAKKLAADIGMPPAP